MKLLDKPIRKEAGVTNKEAIAKLLAGAGVGGGLGVLGEYMLTGKLGWKGGTLGALAGTGASAYLNPESRDKLINTVKSKFSEPDVEGSELGALPGEAITLGGPDASKGRELSEEEYYNNFKQQLASGQEFPEEKSQGMQKYIELYDQKQIGLAKAKEDIATAVKMQKDPKYSKALEEARSGTYFDKLTPGDEEDVSFLVHRYVNDYARETGKMPSPEHILRFTRDTRSQALTPEGWGDYMRDKHVMSGEEEYPLSGMAVQFGGGYAGSKLSKPVIEKMLKTPGGRKALEKVFGKVSGKGAAKLSAKAIPGLNILMDIPEFFIDPNTGEYTSNVGKNISEQDRLMELRENQGLMYGTNNKRNMLYNMSAGALRGWFNPLTSTAVAGKRYTDTAEANVDNIKERGFLQGAKSNIQAGASALAATGSELATPILDLFSKKKVRPTHYSWGADTKAPTEKEIKEHRQANKWHRKEGEDHMDKVELIRRVIRKQASLQKEAVVNPKALKKLYPKPKGMYGNAPGNIPTPTPQAGRMKKLKDWFGGRPSLKDSWNASNKKAIKYGLGTTAGATGLAHLYFGGDDEYQDKMDALKEKPSAEEIQDARDARDKRISGGDTQVENAEIPPELLAGAGGAAAGGLAGYGLAPTLGISRATGAIGGGALTAIASALLANKLKQQKAVA